MFEHPSLDTNCISLDMKNKMSLDIIKCSLGGSSVVVIPVIPAPWEVENRQTKKKKAKSKKGWDCCSSSRIPA
jgi:hypothetical protein